MSAVLMSADDKVRRARELLLFLKQEQSCNTFATLFQDDGPFRRDAYPIQMEFYALGSTKPFRCMMGANGSGKSVCGAYELVCHLMGEYPEWWSGKKFRRRITGWCAGDTNKTLRESLQIKLFGEPGQFGTGMIPKDRIIEVKIKQNTNGVVDYALIRSKFGVSKLVLKSYEEGRESFQAADVDFIWLDEEPKSEIYSECVSRFRGTTADGQCILTFTPLRGISEVVASFIPEYDSNYDEEQYEISGRAFVVCTLDDIPHITEEEKKRKIANWQPHERDARSRGVPSIGSGLIYPVSESTIFVEPLKNGIPDHWPRAYGIDVGIRCTAVIWGAWDQDSDMWYRYSELYVKDALPKVVADAIKARGSWIPGVIDPSARNRSATDGKKLIDMYRAEGLELYPAVNAVTAGIETCWGRMEAGKSKYYNTLHNFKREIRLYRRDDKGQIVKQNDHELDADRYLEMTGRKYARTRARSSVQFSETRF